MYKHCPFCNLDFSNFKASAIGSHIRWCNLNPKRIAKKRIEKKYQKKYCNLCGKEIIGLDRRRRCNECRYKHSNETKTRMSEKRKQWLKINPEKHPWKKSNKFISKPCQLFKKYLDSINLKYISEYNMYDETKRNFSIDIAFPDKKIGIEINGNQHYNKNGTLKQYYQRRHDIIEACGWKLLEIHYLSCFKKENLEKIIMHYEQPDYTVYFSKRCSHAEIKIKQKQITKNKELQQIQKRRERILNSGIDFSKSGWVGKIAKLENISHTTVKKFMRRYLKDFYLNNCFIRKGTDINYLK